MVVRDHDLHILYDALPYDFLALSFDLIDVPGVLGRGVLAASSVPAHGAGLVVRASPGDDGTVPTPAPRAAGAVGGAAVASDSALVSSLVLVVRCNFLALSPEGFNEFGHVFFRV